MNFVIQSVLSQLSLFPSFSCFVFDFVLFLVRLFQVQTEIQCFRSIRLSHDSRPHFPRGNFPFHGLVSCIGSRV